MTIYCDNMIGEVMAMTLYELLNQDKEYLKNK